MQQVNIRKILWSHHWSSANNPYWSTFIPQSLYTASQNKFSRVVSPAFGKTYTYRENITHSYGSYSIVWKCVPEFNIVRTWTMSCILSYWSTEPHKWMVRRWGTVRGYGGPTVVMLSAVDGPPWTKCGSCAWSRGTIHGCRTWSGGDRLLGDHW